MLQSGSHLGPYEILSPLGSGGMGAVYSARDTRLGRDVALKVLPDEFATDADRLSRFRREAHVLASLNHPNIAQIYGLEESGGSPCLVLELVEGETLAERLSRGPVPIEETLAIARQIAEGVEAAHERSIVHRDLKPANIKQTPDGKVKVLDFGLAKAFESDEPATDMSNSPTLMSARTQPNVLMGTAAYMSPEQVRGKPADERSDVWAYGCVLYELLTGRPAFEGESIADIIGAITKTEPNWSALPEATPPHVSRLLRRCLQKDRKRRLHHIADARIEIEEGSSEPATASKRGGSRMSLVSVAAGIVIGAVSVFAVFSFRSATPNAQEMRVDINTPATSDLALAISPDGQSIVCVVSSQGRSQLWLRHLNSAAAAPWREPTTRHFHSGRRTAAPLDFSLKEN